jgi:hypothetical protein
MNDISANFTLTMDFILLSGDIVHENKRKVFLLSIMKQTNNPGQSCNTATHIPNITVNVTETKGTKNTRTSLKMTTST